MALKSGQEAESGRLTTETKPAATAEQVESGRLTTETKPAAIIAQTPQAAKRVLLHRKRLFQHYRQPLEHDTRRRFKETHH